MTFFGPLLTLVAAGAAISAYGLYLLLHAPLERESSSRSASGPKTR